MSHFAPRAYSINDFREWQERDQLVLDPRFQRRSVWSDKARSFLMDTIIVGKPIPKVFIRQITNPQTMRTVREVVDGQQRLRTILSFLSDGFRINRIHNATYGGKTFSELPPELQRMILDYQISVDILYDADDSEVLNIFSRINSYAVILNPQEKLNAEYFGAFKQMAYDLSLEYTNFLITHKVITTPQALRMNEAELVSDLLVVMLVGIKPKRYIPQAYRDYDDDIPNSESLASQFRYVMDSIGVILGDSLSTSNFRRVHMFYTLFCSLYHLQYGIPAFKADRRPISEREFPRVAIGLESVDAIFERNTDDLTSPQRRFLEAAQRATTDESKRVLRAEYTVDAILASLA